MSFQDASRKMPQPYQGTPVTLESWKEIAAYLQRDAKTARKWEKEEGLPIHRHSHKSRSSVYAYPAEIDRWRAGRKVVAEPVERPLWKIPAFAITMLLCLVMVGNGVRPQSAEAEQGQTRTLICSGADCDGQVSSDGKLMLVDVNGTKAIRELATNRTRTLIGPTPGQRVCCMAFSPDASRVAYTRMAAGLPPAQRAATEEVIVVGVDGTRSVTAYRGGSVYAWSADGKKLLVGQLAEGTNTFLWVDLTNGAVQKLPGSHFNEDVAKVSPDGKYIAFNASKTQKDEENVFIMSSDGSGETMVAPSAAYQEPIGWTSDGKYLIFGQFGTTASVWAAPVGNGKLLRPAINMHVDLPDSVKFRGVTRSGSIYYRILSGTSDIYSAMMDPATGKVTSSPIPLPVSRTGGNVLPRWAPDSRRLAYYWAYTMPAGAAARDLAVYSFDTSKQESMATQAKLATGGICWSRDGASILFNSAENPRQPQPAAYRLATNQITQLSSGAKPLLLRSCSDELIAGFDATGIKVRSLATGSEKEIYQFGPNPGTVLPVISHDGRSVAFITAGAGVSTLHIVSSDGGPVRDLATANSPAEIQTLWGTAWSPDDRFLYFARRPDSKSPFELLRVPAAGGTPESVGLKVEDIRDLDIAPDGTRIAFSIGAVNRPEIWSIKGFLPAK